jgi:hypothetical protein
MSWKMGTNTAGTQPRSDKLWHISSHEALQELLPLELCSQVLQP